MTLLLPWAPSANVIWRNASSHCVYLSKPYKAFLAKALESYRQQGAPKLSEGDRVAVTLYLFPPTRRAFDVDNRIKPTLDALTKCGFWKDDKQVRQVTAVEVAVVSGGAIVAKIEPFEQDAEAIASFCNRFNLTPLDLKKHGRKKI